MVRVPDAPSEVAGVVLAVEAAGGVVFAGGAGVAAAAGGVAEASAAAACSSMSACGCSSAIRSFARCTHFCSLGRFSFSRYCRYAATAPLAWPDWRSDSARP